MLDKQEEAMFKYYIDDEEFLDFVKLRKWTLEIFMDYISNPENDEFKHELFQVMELYEEVKEHPKYLQKEQ